MNIRYFTSIVVFILLSGNIKAQTYGCTDRLAVNYNQSATINDGSCIYNPANVEPLSSFSLAGSLSETSGLIFWNNHLWTQNDNTDTNIYSLDTLNGNIVHAYPLSRIKNKDWEEISQDDNYIYVGDLGNNYGNRTDLKIFRIGKNSMLNETPVIDSIGFSYSDQVDFTSGLNNTDFDCEAFIVSEDSIYLFTKQWVSNKTNVYSLPKNPGNYTAKLKSSYNVTGLITGAVYLESEKIIALSGYSDKLEPFVYLLYDFKGSDFFGGNKRKIALLLPHHQTEGIATSNAIKYYISNESFSLYPVINVLQKLHIFDLTSFLGNYLNLPIPFPDAGKNFIILPVPAHDFITVRSFSAMLPTDYILLNLSGKIILKGRLTSENSTISVSGLTAGIYILRIGEERKHSYKIIKE
jgi:hypothetical protein